MGIGNCLNTFSGHWGWVFEQPKVYLTGRVQRGGHVKVSNSQVNNPNLFFPQLTTPIATLIGTLDDERQHLSLG